MKLTVTTMPTMPMAKMLLEMKTRRLNFSCIITVVKGPWREGWRANA